MRTESKITKSKTKHKSDKKRPIQDSPWLCSAKFSQGRLKEFQQQQLNWSSQPKIHLDIKIKTTGVTPNRCEIITLDFQDVGDI